MFLIRLLAGRLYEGWKMTRGKPFRDLYRKYGNELTVETHQNLDILKMYFGKSGCIIGKIRHKMGFHSDIEVFKEGYNAIPPDDTFVDYLAKAQGHCHYGAADMVNIIAMTKLLPKVDWQKAYLQIADEIMSVSKQLTDVILDIMKVFMARYIELTLGDLKKSKVIIENAPNADEVNIPYFSNRPRKYP